MVIAEADTFAGFDRDTKMPIYGRAGMREAWLVDFTQDHIAVYRHPVSRRRGYRDVQRYIRGMSLSLPPFSALSLTVKDILG